MKRIEFVIKEQQDGTLKIECPNRLDQIRMEEAFIMDDIKKTELFNLMRSLSILTIFRYDMIASFTIIFNI